MITEQQLIDSRAKYKAAFTTEDGIAVLQDLKKRFHINTTTFSSDPHEIAYNEGQRTVVMFIISQLEDLPDRALEELKRLAMEREGLSDE